MDATIELHSEEFVCLRLRRPLHFHWSPGQMVYLTMPSVSHFPFEAHPFTIASIDSVMFHPSRAIEKFTGEQGTKETLAKQSLTAGSPFWKELVFFINVRKGFTLQLKKAAMKGAQVKAFVDGPYGIPPDLSTYDTSILIAGMSPTLTAGYTGTDEPAGGAGISYILPTFLNIIGCAILLMNLDCRVANPSSHRSVKEGKSSCHRVMFIWAVRDASEPSLFWVRGTELNAPIRLYQLD